jgi:hypothetical protein
MSNESFLDKWLQKIAKRIRKRVCAREDLERRRRRISEIERHTAFVNAERERANAEEGAALRHKRYS